MISICTSTTQQKLLGLAYQMTGDITASEDICQGVWLRYWQRAQTTVIMHPLAYLQRMVVNASLDYLKAADQKRRNYPGPWLPEPLLEAPSHSQLDLSYGLSVVLARLRPKERAVFLLKECFDYTYADIAEVLQLTAAHCRKLYQRLQVNIRQVRPSITVDTAAQQRLLSFFVAASETGQLEDLLAVLQDDIALYSDGGGKAIAALRPLYGRARCQAFLQAIAKKTKDWRLKACWLHQQCGWLIYEANVLTTVVLCDWKDGQVQQLYLLRNPDKLERLRQVF